MSKAPFEDRLRRLEELSNSIKDSELPIEEAVALFEEGISLARTLEKDLSQIEGKVHILMNSPEAESDTANNDDTEKAEPAHSKKRAPRNTQTDVAGNGEKPELDLFSMD